MAAILITCRTQQPQLDITVDNDNDKMILRVGDGHFRQGFLVSEAMLDEIIDTCKLAKEMHGI